MANALTKKIKIEVTAKCDICGSIYKYVTDKFKYEMFEDDIFEIYVVVKCKDCEESFTIDLLI